MTTMVPRTTPPLDGIRVIDLSRFIAGNMLTVLLADFGADVVKVEDPSKGDSLRELRDDGLSTHWKVYGRNKRSICLDLRSEQGKAVLLDLEGCRCSCRKFQSRYIGRDADWTEHPSKL